VSRFSKFINSCSGVVHLMTSKLTVVRRDCRSQWPRRLRRGSAAAGLPGLWVRISPGGHGCLSLVIVVCCRVEVCASGWSLVQSSRTECGVSQCYREASIMRKPWPTTSCSTIIIIIIKGGGGTGCPVDQTQVLLISMNSSSVTRIWKYAWVFEFSFKCGADQHVKLNRWLWK
jgi:hypothetical protein